MLSQPSVDAIRRLHVRAKGPVPSVSVSRRPGCVSECLGTDGGGSRGSGVLSRRVLQWARMGVLVRDGMDVRGREQGRGTSTGMQSAND